MNTIMIIAKTHEPRCVKLTEELIVWLDGRGIRACVEDHMYKELTNVYIPVERFGTTRGNTAELVVVLGGDGTLIAATRIIGDRDVPILGVNLGSLGFLTEITLDEMYFTLEHVLRGNYEVTNRMMLGVHVKRGGEIIENHRVLNDAVINKGALARIIGMSTSVNNRFLTHFKADGLIVSTPTGSTGYSLSANGPIIQPDLECICITPICPHTLTNRPIVVSSISNIEINMNEIDDSVYLTLDGQVGVKLQGGDIVQIRKANNSTRLIKSRTKDYFEVIRTKLKWGER